MVVVVVVVVGVQRGWASGQREDSGLEDLLVPGRPGQETRDPSGPLGGV